jgi:hypothetical protein
MKPYSFTQTLKEKSMSNPFIKFQIRYLKAYLKYVSFVGRENKTIFNIKSRLIREYNRLYEDVKKLPSTDAQRVRAFVMMSAVEAELHSLYKSFDIDSRFVRKGSLYDKFPLWVRYKNARGDERIHHMTETEQVTAAHIVYNRLRNKKSHLKDEGKEHEYTHSLTYWTERLAYLFQEECARRLSPRESVIEAGNGTGRGDSATARECGGSSHE